MQTYVGKRRVARHFSKLIDRQTETDKQRQTDKETQRDRERE